jgi:hypothetical protein
MMLSPYDEAHLFAVLQADHSRVSGLLAAHWGNDLFARPAPYPSMVLAAQEHDNRGWWGVELKPYLSDDGYPLDYLDTVGFLGPRWLDSWGQGVEMLAAQDPYAALMVLIHGVGILTQGYGLMTRIKRYADDPTTAAFVQGQETRRAELLALLRQDEALVPLTTDDQLWANYRLMEAYDQLSQLLCNRFPLTSTARQRGPSLTLTNIRMPVAPGRDDTLITVEPIDERRAVVHPYPFDVDGLAVPIDARLLPRRRFASPDDYLEAFLRAPRVTVTYTLHAA